MILDKIIGGAVGGGGQAQGGGQGGGDPLSELTKALSGGGQ